MLFKTPQPVSIAENKRSELGKSSVAEIDIVRIHPNKGASSVSFPVKWTTLK